MKVKAIKSATNKLYYPADKEITQLPEKFQPFIKALGKTFLTEASDLTHATDSKSREILKEIEAEGASLQVGKVLVTERVICEAESSSYFGKV